VVYDRAGRGVGDYRGRRPTERRRASRENRAANSKVGLAANRKHSVSTGNNEEAAVQASELSLGEFNGSAVALLRGENSNHGCTFLITGPNEFCVRFPLVDSDSELVAFVGALRDLRSELDEAGALTP
jgi:hypothetical protein